jgi:hypothetical protein
MGVAEAASAWDAFAKEAAWCVRANKDTSATALHALVCSILTCTKFVLRDSIKEHFRAIPSAAIDRALCTLDRHGLTEMLNHHVRICPTRFARAITSVCEDARLILRAQMISAEDGMDDEVICCTTCGRTFGLLNAVCKLKSDERGFFCHCGGDMLSRQVSSDARAEQAKQIVNSLSPLLAKLTTAEISGNLPSAPRPKTRPRKDPVLKKAPHKRKKISK